MGAIGGKIVPTRDIPTSAERDIPTATDPAIRGIAEYDLLILPGGAKAMEYMRQDTGLLAYISRFHQYGGVIGAICHGAQLLISAHLVKGRRISGYYSIKDDINNAGGTYVDAPFVIDDRIITSPHYKHLGPWMKEVIFITAMHFPWDASLRGAKVDRPSLTQTPTALDAHLREW